MSLLNSLVQSKLEEQQKNKIKRETENLRDEFVTSMAKAGAKEETLDMVSKIKAESPEKLTSAIKDIQDIVAKTPIGQTQTMEQKILEEGKTIEAKKIVERNLSRMELNKELQDFFLVDNNIPRTDSGLIGRTVQGLQNVASSFDQSNVTGFAAATHDALKKRLRVRLVRAAGDVGNINIVEQKAAEQIIPGFFDASGTAKLKRAFLAKASEALSTKEGPELESSIKTILNEFAQSDAFIGPKGDEARKLTKKYKVGEVIALGKKKYKVKDVTNPLDPELELVKDA